MRLIWVLCACVAGALLAFVQIRLLMRLIQKPNIGMTLLKLPLWALPMLAAAYFSIGALIGMAVAASATYIGCCLILWRRLRKGERE